MPADIPARDLAHENEELRQRLREAEELIAAVREGAVDGLALPGGFATRQGADDSYRTLVETMSEGAALLDATGLVLYANAALARLLAVPLPALPGQPLLPHLPARYRAGWAKLLAQAAHAPVRAELSLPAESGQARPCAVSINALEMNGIRSLALVVTDLSDRTRISIMRARVAAQDRELTRQTAEIEVQREAAAEATRILEGIPQIAWTTDSRGRNLFINGRWADFIGHEPTEAERQLQQFLHPDDYDRAIRAWLLSRDRAEPLTVEVRVRAAQGEYRWLLVQARPSFDEQGQLQQWIGTYTDIDEQKQAQGRLEQAQRQLREKNEQLTRLNVDLDTFVYAASHDLKQPVGNVEGLLHALLEELPPERSRPVQDILRLMVDSLARFQRTIDQLTDISRLQRQHLVLEPVALQGIVQGVVLDLAPQVARAQAELTLDLDDCPPVLCSEKNLRGIVFNLLSNSLKYHHPDRLPRVVLRARPVPDHQVRLSVQDNGLGLDPQGRERLFGMFERLHTHVEGSGIGLFMVKKMVENVGGRVEVESELGIGSTFSVYLPYPAR